MREERFYREWVRSPDLVTFRVEVEESDLLISAERDLSETARRKLTALRAELKSFIALRPEFERSLEPVEVPADAAEIVRDMAWAAGEYGVGPMAAVAGAVARHVGLALLGESTEVIIENGGDIFIRSRKARRLALFAGEKSPFSGKLRVTVQSQGDELGVCTSSGTVGHSLSFGNADAVVAIASSATLADAAATAICNRVKKADDVEPAIQLEGGRGLLRGLLIVIGEKMGAWGELELSTRGSA